MTGQGAKQRLMARILIVNPSPGNLDALLALKAGPLATGSKSLKLGGAWLTGKLPALCCPAGSRVVGQGQVAMGLHSPHRPGARGAADKARCASAPLLSLLRSGRGRCGARGQQL